MTNEQKIGYFAGLYQRAENIGGKIIGLSGKPDDKTALKLKKEVDSLAAEMLGAKALTDGLQSAFADLTQYLVPPPVTTESIQQLIHYRKRFVGGGFGSRRTAPVR